jgi:hypothetical protein
MSKHLAHDENPCQRIPLIILILIYPTYICLNLIAYNMLERMFLSQSPEVSNGALNHGDNCSSASAAFARACREVMVPFTGKNITIY